MKSKKTKTASRYRPHSTIRVPKEIANQLRLLAKQNGRTLNGECVYALTRYSAEAASRPSL